MKKEYEMAILDRENKIIYTGGNIAWLPYIIQRGFNFYFRYKNGKATPLNTLEEYKKEVGLVGYEVIELEEINKNFGIEIIEIGKSAVLIDGFVVDTRTDNKNIVLSFVKIACDLGYCTSKTNFASRKSKLRNVKRNITDLEVFLDISGVVRINVDTHKVKNEKKKTELIKILEQTGLKYSTYTNRVKRGWDKHIAMMTPLLPSHKSMLKESTDHKGRKFESVEKMIQFHGISKQTFYKRKREGLSLEQCLAPAYQKFNSSSRVAINSKTSTNIRIKTE